MLCTPSGLLAAFVLLAQAGAPWSLQGSVLFQRQPASVTLTAQALRIGPGPTRVVTLSFDVPSDASQDQAE
jgi:hypothetical protein